MTKTKIIFLLLLSIFFLPIVFSGLLYYYSDHFHLPTNNYGHLVSPPMQVKEVLGSDFIAPSKWQIVFAPLNCESKAARRIMFTLQQMRKALGQQADRVKLTLWVQTDCQPKHADNFFKCQLTFRQNKNLQKIVAHDQDKLATNKIYLIDPQANLFMYYPASADPMKIFKDLKKVLEVSQIG